MNSYTKAFLILLGIQNTCCFLLDTGTISEHRDGWSDWSCQQQGDFCFKSRTCNSTADFNCSKTSEVTVTNCPCVADTGTISEHRDGWSNWSCQQQGDFCFKSRTCNSTADFNCSKTSEVTVTNCPCVADTGTISEHRDGWSDWSCQQQGDFCFKSRTCNSTADFNCSKTNEVTVTNCPCVADTSTISEHRDGWSDWSCQQQGGYCFKSRTCNSTADFNCSKTNEVTVTTCPCVAEWSPWGGWTCHKDQGVCLQLRTRSCVSGFKESDCLSLQGEHFQETSCDESCNNTGTISEHRDGWSDWRCQQQGEFCFKSRTCNSTADFNCSKTSEVTVTNCPCSSDTDTISEHRDGWSDWSCKKQGDFCFKSRTCNSTADFNCSKTSEVTVTNCPCDAGHDFV
ncbi:uncharacterized protein LOC132743487 isoform X2 [Ruditapes philippinarum]|uniref:uncharacterized protein LOC132743487 isoform X2 n=1 Tax=Ruditapes philippinarum TaxID=129788 RepID=UPI00295B609D|nr:uncharacterized protein LOC132743487 isoform X2 [Ruditapes philippinarum]